jgi:DNA-binding MarR family transcriptional regulator
VSELETPKVWSRAHAHTDVEAGIEEHVRYAVAIWPSIDPQVEGLVNRISKAERYIENDARAVLGRKELTKEEFKVLITLHSGVRSHGSLCRDLMVSTGAMTNRLDKLEERGFVRRHPDPHDRRGVLLELTDAGRRHLDDYIDAAASRERDLTSGLTSDEMRELNRLLGKLLGSLQAKVAGGQR